MSEAEAKKAIENFFTYFNAQDEEALLDSLHYPHVRIASGRVIVTPERSKARMQFKYLIENEGWHHSSLDSVKAVHVHNDKVHFSIAFSRYNADGAKYATHESLWIVTKENDQWGVLARSSFAP